MKIETQPLENHQVKLTVEVEAEKFEEAKEKAARKLSKQVRVPGFRPGKAPYPVIVRQLGEPAILEEAIEVLVKDIYPHVIEESGVEPYGPGSLENVVSVDPPVLEFVVPLAAEATLGDYTAIVRAYEKPQVSEDEIEKFLNNVREQQAVIEPVERAAQEGDLVTIRLDAHRLQADEGTNPVLVEERSMPVLIQPEIPEVSEEPEDEEKPDEWPFPGFSREILGMAAGEEKTLSYTFPEDSRYESLRNVEAEFHWVVETVKSRTLPEVNDELAASMGDFADLAALQAEIRSGLEDQAKEKYDSEYEEAVLDELISMSEFKYPPQMLENEIDELIHNLQHRLSDSGMDMDMYLKMRNIDMAALREEVKPNAETRLKKSIALVELAKKEKVQVQPNELQQETARMVYSLSQSLSEKEARQLNNRDVINNITSSVLVDLMTKKTLGRLRQIASGQVDEETPPAETGEEVSEPESVETTDSAGEAAAE